MPEQPTREALDRLDRWLLLNEDCPDRHISEHRDTYVSLFDLRTLSAALHARLSQPVAETKCVCCGVFACKAAPLAVSEHGLICATCASQLQKTSGRTQPAAESAEPGPSDTLPRRVGYSTTTDARLIGSCADELEQLGQWVRAARDFNRDDAVDEIARAIENRVRALRAAMRKERP